MQFRFSIIILSLVVLAVDARAACEAPSDWFPQQSANLEPTFSRPSSNCEFHKTAWQTFLWLTQVPDPSTAPDRIRLLNMPTADSLFQPSRAPATLNEAAIRMFRTQPLLLKPRVAKSAATTSFADIKQAGSKGILVDQVGHAVYYASHVSPVFYQFVRTNRLFIKDNYVKDPSLNFPVGSLELKSSWQILRPGTSADGFYTTPALVQPLACADGGVSCSGDDVVTDPSKQPEHVTAALVGLHIVAVLEDHPEALWATFEHVRNAPDVQSDTMPSDPVSEDGFTFYTAGTTLENCNKLNSSEGGMPVSFDSKTKLLSPITNVCRRFPFGMGAPDDTSNIQDLNASVKRQLGPGSVWQNYFLVGGVWFSVDNGLKPSLAGQPIQKLVTGSVHLSNSTMETFNQQTKKNCFACHDTAEDKTNGIPALNLNISHVMKNGVVDREQAATIMAAPVGPDSPLETYADVQKLLNDFVTSSGLTPFTHGLFWNKMSYSEFVSGNVPGIEDTGTFRILVPGKSAESNLVMALRGTKGSPFDPDTGAIGRMPLGGPPYMADSDIDRLADWIDRGAKDGQKNPPR